MEHNFTTKYAISGKLYLDNVHTSKVSTDNTSQIVLGYCAFSDANNDSLLINVRPPRI
jgi:hypothetical protein